VKRWYANVIKPYWGFCSLLPWQADGKLANFIVRPRTFCRQSKLRSVPRWWAEKFQELTTPTSTSPFNFNFTGETRKNYKLTMAVISDTFLSLLFVVYILAYVIFVLHMKVSHDRFCDLVVRVPGYRSRGPGFDFWHYQIVWEVVGLDRGILHIVSITEELLEWKSSGCGSRKPRLMAVGIRCADHAISCIRRSWQLTSLTRSSRSIDIVWCGLEPRSFVFSLVLWKFHTLIRSIIVKI
jgi:hypothetical protein